MMVRAVGKDLVVVASVTAKTPRYRSDLVGALYLKLH